MTRAMTSELTSEQSRNISRAQQTLIAISITIVMFAAAIGGATAGTLENMERERAILLETVLSGDMNTAERESRIQVAKTRLVDLERMVLRDKKLIGRNT
ncbi:MAG: flagellar basal body-associated protein FliL, partial [Alphaproteobacteria bacterium]